MNALDRDALLQPVQRLLRDAAEGAHAIAADPAGRRQFQCARQPAVIGEEQQPLGVHVEAADADQPRQVLGQGAEDRLAAFRVGMGRHQAARLVAQEQPGPRPSGQRLAVDGDAVPRPDIEGRGVDRLAVDRDAPGGDPGLGLAPRGEPGAGNHLGDAVAFVSRLLGHASPSVMPGLVPGIPLM